MGAAFDLVELTVLLIIPICTDGAAMTMRFRWHDKLTCCVGSEAPGAIKLIRTPAVPRSSWTGERRRDLPNEGTHLQNITFAERQTQRENERERERERRK